MKTISVRDAAQALSISPRAVLYRREKGQLKGLLIKNDHGVAEYRIYPNKEIVEGLKRMGSPLVSGNDAVQETDIVDAVTTPSEISFDPCDDEIDKEVGEAELQPGPAGGKPGDTRSAANNVADELWNNLISRYTEILGAKDQLIGEMRIELEEKERRLKLLPDLQKQAEEERKATELKALEVEALNKQIAALDEQRRAAEAEAERVKAEKEVETIAIMEQLATLKNKLEKLEQPWWKKWFSAGGE